jgi:hypothetical protein
MDRRKELRDLMKLRQWGELDYHPCLEIIAAWDAVVLMTDWSKLSEKEQKLRGSSQKGLREHVHAAIFAWGISHRLNVEHVHVARTDVADHDAIMKWVKGGELCFAPVQLKELVPTDLSPKGSLQDIIDRLPDKYPDSPDLVVVILHSRPNSNGKIEISIPPNLRLGGLHIFGCCSPCGEKWFVTGNLVRGEFEKTEFMLPGRGSDQKSSNASDPVIED